MALRASVGHLSYSLLPMATAAAYCRVSTAAQAVDGLSLPEQEKALKAEAEAKGWEISLYVDKGVSGRLEHRPQLDRLLADAEAGTIEYMLVSRLDRLGRNTRNLHNLLHRLDAAGVKFVCLSPVIDTSTASGKLQLKRPCVCRRVRVRHDRREDQADSEIERGSWQASCASAVRLRGQGQEAGR